LTAGESWLVEHQRGSASILHGRSVALAGTEDGSGRRIRILEVDSPAVVLGSSQPATDIDPTAAAEAGVEVVRRRSGGGAVLLWPDAVVWIDVLIPAGDSLWDADVRRATWWVAETWAAALNRVGAGPARVWRGDMQVTPWSRRICFASLGPGEVYLASGKVVGVAQRRTRAAALFQTAALLSWDPERLLGLLRLDETERAQAAAELRSGAVGIGAERGAALVDAFVEALLDGPD
jgi:lipoate-protein ligase A